jgi:hypothetical protein
MAVPTFKDELDDLPINAAAATPVATAEPATATTAAPAQPTVVHVVEEEDDDKAGMKPAKAAEDEEDLSVDWGDKELMKRGDGLDRLRPEKGKAVRFAILGEYIKAHMSYTHFIDKKGTYRCLVDKIKRANPKRCMVCKGVVVTDDANPKKTCTCAVPSPGNPDATGYCCKKLKENSEPTIVVLVVHYKNADPTEGGLEKGVAIDWDIKYVQLTKANFQAITRLPEEEQTVNDVDIVMMHANRAFGYEFHKKSAKARWKTNPAWIAEVTEKVKPLLDGKKLDGKLGRKVTDLEMKALISSLAAGSEDAKLGDVESL